jgi:Dehydrogenases with different specificities (related to short-chain alcohol dehydrogenases)
MMLQFRINTLGALKVTERALGLMENGMKRLCYVSSEAGSIGNAHRDGMFGYCMSKASLNMAVRILHNDLYQKGFTFRIYHPGWMKSYMAADAGDTGMNGYLEPRMSANAALEQFLSDRDCENILIMQDVDGCLWSF